MKTLKRKINMEPLMNQSLHLQGAANGSYRMRPLYKQTHRDP